MACRPDAWLLYRTDPGVPPFHNPASEDDLNMPRILLHTCCGPCTIYPLKSLRLQNWEVHGHFYNPNIHPFQEFDRRLTTLRQLAAQQELPLIVRSDYPLEEFLRKVVYREQDRCLVCYSMRLEATARLAKKSKFDAFSTTLLYSKRQKHELVCAVARDAAHRYGIRFHYEDFRSGWKEGQEVARQLGLYRQQYCGCIFSEKERFQGKLKGAA
jgi:predicted adenine nucleotide alpha hydrolase (AANH) superfamily ATPase